MMSSPGSDSAPQLGLSIRIDLELIFVSDISRNTGRPLLRADSLGGLSRMEMSELVGVEKILFEESGNMVLSSFISPRDSKYPLLRTRLNSLRAIRFVGPGTRVSNPSKARLAMSYDSSNAAITLRSARSSRGASLPNDRTASLRRNTLLSFDMDRSAGMLGVPIPTRYCPSQLLLCPGSP